MSMNWSSLLNTMRIGARSAREELGRSPFNSDHDKIIFSGAFRRLARKTQVHPLATNDHVHNRLTHSLEVACVGRSLGILVGQMLESESKLPEGLVATDVGDIVQSTCLAHDIGNPPFGHTGEEAIRNWFANDGQKYLEGLKAEEQNDLKTFEGNAQGLRVLTTSEYHPYQGGMRLTYATLASFIKYPWTSLPAISGKRPKHNKFGVYCSELDLFHEIAGAVGLIKQGGDDWYCRHPFVNLMEAADDFCYGLIDLEDGLEMNILSWDEVYGLLEPVIARDEIDQLNRDLSSVAYGRKPALVRGKVIAAYIQSAAKAFLENEKLFLDGEASDLIKLCDAPVRESVVAAKKLAKEKIFTHPRKIELEIGAYNVVATLLSVMCAAVSEWVGESGNISFRSRRALDLIGEETFHPAVKDREIESRWTPKYLAIMRILDFVGGMTDSYATYLAKQFNGMGEAR